MQQAVLHHFPNVEATYRFTHRDKDVFFTHKSIEDYKATVSRESDPVEFHMAYPGLTSSSRVLYTGFHQGRPRMAEKNMSLF